MSEPNFTLAFDADGRCHTITTDEPVVSAPVIFPHPAPSETAGRCGCAECIAELRGDG